MRAILLADTTEPERRSDRFQALALRKAAVACAEAAFRRSIELDHDGAFPDVEFAALHECGLMAAPLALQHGGAGLGVDAAQAQLTVDVLSAIGWGSLPLGRLYEGHVNALKLIHTHGSPSQVASYADDARRGCLFGVWNTQGADGLVLENHQGALRLRGAKIFASGAGRVARPLVTARCAIRGLVMVVPRHCDPARADLSAWKAHGMRASASGSFDFTGMEISEDEIIGGADAYHLQPAFSAGAWRFCAVQLGGAERLLDCTREHLLQAGRAADPHQLARMGQAAIAAQGARLWVEAAAKRAEGGDVGDADALIAFVNLTRAAVERAALDIMELAQRSIGLPGFLRAHPFEHVLRDLATYLRQPAPDKALVDGGEHVAKSSVRAGDLWRE